MVSMQKGDVSLTWSNTNLLFELTSYSPSTSIENGIKKFVDWYKIYYKI